MVSNIQSPVEQRPVEQQPSPGNFANDRQKIKVFVKSAASITSIFATISFSAVLAYQAPSKWWLTTFSVTLVNLYALPKVLCYGNVATIKTALIVNFVALGSLILGGMVVASVLLSKSFITQLQTYRINQALGSAFLVTGFIGYCFPHCWRSLGKAYDMINEPNWQRRFENLHAQFHRMPEVGRGLLQCNLTKSFLLYLALCVPREMHRLFQIVGRQPPDEVYSMIIALSERVSLQGVLTGVIEAGENFRRVNGMALPNEIQVTNRQRLEFALRFLTREELPQAIELLLTNMARLIPDTLSVQQFLSLFQGPVLNEANTVIQRFFELMDGWGNLGIQYFQLEDNILQLHQEVQNMQPDQRETLLQRHTQLNQEFINLRTQVERVYQSRRIWQNVVQLRRPGEEHWEELQLPFDHLPRLLNLLPDQNLLNDEDATDEIDNVYHSLIGEGRGEGNQPNVADRLQLIANRLIQREKNDEDPLPKEEVSAYIYLGSDHLAHHFIAKDYEDLATWLNINSFDELEDKMKQIGLATHEDLYDRGLPKESSYEQRVLPRQGQISKAEVRANLEKYIKAQASKKTAPRIEHIQHQVTVESRSRFNLASYKIGEKVSSFVYRIIASGLILVPVLVHPRAGAVGFFVGGVFFILRRFGMPGTQSVINLSDQVINTIPLGSSLRNLYSRRVAHLDFSMRTNLQKFVNAGYIERTRILNWQIMLSLLVTNFTIRFEAPGLGGFLQGLAIANEVVDFF